MVTCEELTQEKKDCRCACNDWVWVHVWVWVWVNDILPVTARPKAAAVSHSTLVRSLHFVGGNRRSRPCCLILFARVGKSAL